MLHALLGLIRRLRFTLQQSPPQIDGKALRRAEADARSATPAQRAVARKAASRAVGPRPERPQGGG